MRPIRKGSERRLGFPRSLLVGAACCAVWLLGSPAGHAAEQEFALGLEIDRAWGGMCLQPWTDYVGGCDEELTAPLFLGLQLAHDLRIGQAFAWRTTLGWQMGLPTSDSLEISSSEQSGRRVAGDLGVPERQVFLEVGPTWRSSGPARLELGVGTGVSSLVEYGSQRLQFVLDDLDLPDLPYRTTGPILWASVGVSKRLGERVGLRCSAVWRTQAAKWIRTAGDYDGYGFNLGWFSALGLRLEVLIY